jgi:GxxExxY protein
MNTDNGSSETTKRAIGCAYKVSNKLGCGFLEKVYENALALELRKVGLKVQQQYPITIRYDGVIVGEYVADLLIENWLLIELKAAEDLSKVHYAQCINYLKATGLTICLLMNFGQPKVKIRRFSNRLSSHRRPSLSIPVPKEF